MATFTASIAASTDDATELSGTPDLTGNALNCNSPAYYLGLRFPSVTIPAGSTITAATLEFEITSGSFDDPNLTIYAHDADNPAAYTTTTNDISGRTPTTATVNWIASSIGTGVKTSPDITTVIQEIIDRPGWTSGNAIAPILNALSASSFFRVRSYDAGTGTPAKLNITYNAASPVTVTLNTLSRALSAVGLTVAPGAVVVSAGTISRVLSAVPLGVVPGGVTVTFDTLSLLAEVLDIAVGQSVGLNVLNAAVTVPSLSVVPGAAAVLLASLGHVLSADSLAVVPGAVVVDAATLAAVLDAVTLGISSIGGDVTILLQALAGALSPVEVGVIPGDMVISLQTFEPSLNIERLLVFMMLGCVMLGDRANYGAAVGDFRRYLVAVDDRGGCCE